MSLYDDLIAALPELADKPEEFLIEGSIRLHDNSDGQGAFIKKWEYAKPIPASLKSYDRT
jgi:hypothetical protein